MNGKGNSDNLKSVSVSRLDDNPVNYEYTHQYACVFPVGSSTRICERIYEHASSLFREYSQEYVLVLDGGDILLKLYPGIRHDLKFADKRAHIEVDGSEKHANTYP